MVKNVLQSEDVEQAQTLYPEVQAYLDRLATRGIVHRNKAANYKRQLSQHLQALAQG